MMTVNLFCILTIVLFFYAHRNPGIIEQKVGSVLEKCSWLVDRLSLCLGKTESILRTLKNITDFTILCDCHVIKGSDSVIY